MTPQLQQAIRLLQYSTLELKTHVQDMLDSNPLLETEDENTSTSEPERDLTQAPEVTDRGDVSNPEAPENFPDDLPVDSTWEDIYESSGSPLSGAQAALDERDPYASQSDDEESLIDRLLWQIHLAPLNERDRLIAINLIDSIDENGYLGEDLVAIHATLDQEIGPGEGIDLAEIETILHFIQHLDPVGCGARNLTECLLAQLTELNIDPALIDLSRKIIVDHIDLLGAHDVNTLRKKLAVDDISLQAAIDLIQSLNPRPGAQISARPSEYIIPDIFVRKQNQRWQVELNTDSLPRLRINRTYAALLRRADNSSDNTYIRGQLQEARWFIKSLQSRHATLLRVATAIVELQQGFLEYGEEAMKPLILRDIAEQVEMHESTISRVTTQKYMYTPRGIFEFKYFFSSHVGTADGGECSAVAIRAMIRKLIESEPPEKPLSDSIIATILRRNGVQVARRTVAKYREHMNIHASSERKRLLPL